MPDFLPYGRQSIDEADIDAVVDVLESDWLTTGPAVEAFEERLATIGGAEHAVAVSSGTAALHAAYHAAGVGPGDEVIVPALTFSATANAARYLGATVRFADVEPETLTVDPASVDALADEETKVIVPVDYAGHASRHDELQKVADACGATVVRDAAHSLGGGYKSRPIGSLADLTVFSFHPVKAATSAEGGAVLTDDDQYAEALRRFRNHGMDKRKCPPGDSEAGDWAYDIDEIGYNFRLSDLHCALGLSQLEKLDDFIARRRQLADGYRQRLDDLDALELPPDADWCQHAYHLFVVRVPADSRRAIFEELRDRDIGVQVHYIPVNMLSAYRDLGYDPEQTPVALETYRRIFSIPCFPEMDDGDLDRVASALRDAVRRHVS